MIQRDMSPTERAFYLGVMVSRCQHISVNDVVRLTGMQSASGARRAMNRYSRVVPLIEDSGVWRVLEATPAKGGGNGE